METIEKILQRCHERREHPLLQQQTVVLPATYERYPYNFQVCYAHERSALLSEFKHADISILPIGKPPFDRAPADWNRKDKYRDRVNQRQRAISWRTRRWYASWGIGVYTGKTSRLGDAYWHDIVFTHCAIMGAPNATTACLNALINATEPVAYTHKGQRFALHVSHRRLFTPKHARSEAVHLQTQPDPQ